MAILSCRRRAIALAACAWLLVCGSARAQHPLDTDVKAAYLYNFIKFVEWPDAVANGSAAFRICVLADADFTRAIDAIIQGEAVFGRPLARATPADGRAARECQILYVGDGEGERGARVLAAVRDLPVLTVGDSPRFLDSGGTIQFVVENRRVRFDISMAAASRAKIRLSTKLLRVARTVRENGS